MDVLKKSKVAPAGPKPLEAGTAVPTPERAASPNAAQQGGQPAATAPPPQMPGACDGEVRATVHPQEDGTCVIEVTCSCGNVIQVQCITQ
jgi:hypothetical protein